MSRTRPGVVAAGVVVLVVAVLTVAGVPGPYAVAVGVAAGLPVVTLQGPFGGYFDAAGYREARGRAGRLFDAAVTGLMGLFVGASAAFLVGAAGSGGVPALLGAGASAALGTVSAFLSRNAEFVRTG